MDEEEKPKTCKRCGKSKPMRQFRRYVTNVGHGTRSTCRLCEEKLRRRVIGRASWKQGQKTRRCGGCRKTLPVGEFYQQTYRQQGGKVVLRPGSKCKECHKKVTRAAYYARRKKNLRIIFDHFHENPCVDCGETNPALLEFDHRDEKKKNFTIGRSYAQVAERTLRKEIALCDVRCKSCHHLRTMARHGYYSDPEARAHMRQWEANKDAFDNWEERDK